MIARILAVFGRRLNLERRDGILFFIVRALGYRVLVWEGNVVNDTQGKSIRVTKIFLREDLKR